MAAASRQALGVAASGGMTSDLTAPDDATSWSAGTC